jgi:arsenate reductase-like glutaredoxin family protein
MASEVFSTEIITLLDGTEVELRPLPIAKLRKFMRMWSEHVNAISEKLAANVEKDPSERDFTEADMSDAQFDIFVKMCSFGLEDQLKTKEMTDKKFLEHLENVLDQDSIYRILDATGGLKIGGGGDDPNPTTPLLGGPGTN